ncbi:DsrE family protein [Sunxiuqinia sp. A32]|uniref:DsrE family protein n=1 Tax=Sunxiuqinia sp. A32 TaxID=3461496 RepID=UPI0040457FE4
METKKKLVVVITQGLDNERSSVAWSIANGGIKNGLDVSIFLVSSGIDWVRKGAAERARPNPEDPTMKDMIQFVVENGCEIGVCPPCAKVRGYDQDSLLEGVQIVGSVFIHERVKEGAALLSF